ncbi:uncharacterized protein LOC107474380 [Arachis duranensis]|uniref:Uncharacterized protein LOC107474380 n=1 Tax=Arachis duranensis TaxID=130453 RepID=A0A9C6TRV0_ARADU|nr:uncharacterized protein LOC107474380 [Arachis duranensis]
MDQFLATSFPTTSQPLIYRTTSLLELFHPTFLVFLFFKDWSCKTIALQAYQALLIFLQMSHSRSMEIFSAQITSPWFNSVDLRLLTITQMALFQQIPAHALLKRALLLSNISWTVGARNCDL